MLPPDQMDAVLKVAKEVAGSSNNGQLVYLIVVGAALLGAVAKYFTGLHNKVSDRLDKVQDEQTKFLTTANEKLVTCVNRQTEVQEKLLDVITRYEATYERSHVQASTFPIGGPRTN